MKKNVKAQSEKKVDKSLKVKDDVNAKLTRMRQEGIFSKTVKHLLIVTVLIICTEQLLAQQYKFTKCDNYNFVESQGMTINEAIVKDVVVEITNDSIKFSTPVISISEEIKFKILKREGGIDDVGRNYVKVMIMDTKSQTVIIITIIDENNLSTNFNSNMH